MWLHLNNSVIKILTAFLLPRSAQDPVTTLLGPSAHPKAEVSVSQTLLEPEGGGG